MEIEANASIGLPAVRLRKGERGISLQFFNLNGNLSLLPRRKPQLKLNMAINSNINIFGIDNKSMLINYINNIIYPVDLNSLIKFG